MTAPIRVTSHVARDLVQNAAYFSTVPKVVWEYVSNALDNPDGQNSVIVDVSIKKAHITIRDNAAGMTRQDLARFFTMHGENLRRQQGKKVRGRFGTGKCAAFGIASRLRIDTVHLGRRNTVELSLRDVQASSGDAIPVRDVAIDTPTTDSSGTTVTITELHTRQLEIPGTQRYIERHVGKRHQAHQVTINGQLCEVVVPVATHTSEFRPPDDVAAQIGPVTLTVSVSPVPLDADFAGIDILSNENRHATALGELLPLSETSKQIFGEVDVPKLEEYEGPFPPFNATRDNTLSPQNPIVAALYGWLSVCVRQVVADIERQAAERRRSAEARRLRQEASKIESLLNEDFRALQIELAAGRRGTTVPNASPQEVSIGPLSPEAATVFPDTQGTMPADSTSVGPPHGDGTRGQNPAGSGDEDRPGASVASGEGTGSPREAVPRPPRSGGFALDFRHETASAPRSRYESATKTIVINLDHPQMQAARRLGEQESAGFRQISYEVTFVEYALALGNEHLQRDALMAGEDALYEIRDTINRLASRLGAVFGGTTD